MNVTVRIVKKYSDAPWQNIKVSIVFDGAFSGSLTTRTNKNGDAIFQRVRPNCRGKILVSEKVVYKGRINDFHSHSM